MLGYRALMWQSLVTDGNAGVLGDYAPLVWLPRKAALFLFEFHDTDFRAQVPLLPPLPAPQDRDEYLDVHFLVKNREIRKLLDSLTVRPAAKDKGHFGLFGTLAIGHEVYTGYQRVQCWPFTKLLYYGANRQDFVIVRPPGTVPETFVLTPDSVWYCKTLLLFDMQSKTDSGFKEYQCAYVSVLNQMKPRMPDQYEDLRLSGSRVIYEHTSEVFVKFRLMRDVSC